ncbi:MAG: glycosyltransferase family 4 protein [bacterium]
MEHIESKRILPLRLSTPLGARGHLARGKRRLHENPIFPIFTLPSDELGNKAVEKGYNKQATHRICVGVTWIDIKPIPTRTYISISRVLHSIAKALSQHFKIEHLKLHEDTEQERRSALVNLFRVSNIIFTSISSDTYIETFRIREELALDIPIALLILGNLPVGGTALRDIMPFLRKNDSIVVSSKADKEVFGRIIEKCNISLFYLPFGIDCRIFRPHSQANNRIARLSMGVSLSAPLLLYTGRIHPEKNLHALLWIMEEVAKEHEDAILCIAGPIENDRSLAHHFDIPTDSYYDYIRKEIANRNLAHHILLLGSQPSDSLSALYSTADVFINCTIAATENFGYSQVESMACGTPVVCSHIGGLKDTVLEGETGFFMDTIATNHGIKLDWKKGADAVLKLLEDGNLREEMSRKSVEHATNNFGMEKFSKNLSEMVEIILRRKDLSEDQNLGEIVPTNWAKRLWEHTENPVEFDECAEFSVHKPKLPTSDYKYLIEPYVTYVADNITLYTNSIPYFVTPIRLIKQRLILKAMDPLFPASYRIQPWELSILNEINGQNSIEQIASKESIRQSRISYKNVISLIQKLLIEGIICLRSMQTR